jgi:hypothetical protein
MVTPTFFAGACIVFAATLAYGTTQTHLVFGGGDISTCAAASCSRAAGPVKAGGIPLRTSASPATGGARGTVPGGASNHAPAGGTNANAGRPGGMASGTGTSAEAGGQQADILSWAYSSRLPVIIAYRTMRSWHGGFQGAMTITNRSKAAIRNWLLWMRYRRARMENLWGARWYAVGPRAPGAAVVAPRRGQPALAPGASTRFTFRVSGHAGPPAGCFFDTSRCSFRRSGR